MAKLEEIEDSDEEEPPKTDEPKMDFNDMLKKAADMKSQALKEKRRLWENAPEWLKNTMMHERQGEVKDIRETKSVAQRLEAAANYKDKGNEFVGRGKLEKASAEYVKAIAIFQLFMRNDKREEIWLEKLYEKFEPADRSAAEKIMVGCFTNLAMILLKQEKAYEAVYACNMALELDPLNVKALYRRGLGRVGEDTSTSLELGVKDLEKAMKLAPDDAGIAAAYRKHKKEHIEQRRKDGKTYGGMFERELYSKEEQERMEAEAARQSEKAGVDAMLKNMPNEELKRHVKEMGIDVDDPHVRKQLEAKARRRQELEMQKKAKEMGVDLDDPEVKKLLEMFEKERDLENLQKKLGDIPWWRRLLVRALDKNKIINFQNFCYLLIVLNMLFKMRSMYKSWPGSPNGATYGHADDENYVPSVWSSHGEF